MCCKIGANWLLLCGLLLCGMLFPGFVKKTHSILAYFPSNFFSMLFVKFLVVHPYISIDTAIASKNYHFILSERSYFHMINNLSITAHTFPMCMLTSLSVDEILLPRYMNWSTYFRSLPFDEVMALFCLKHIRILSEFTLRTMPLTAYSRLCSRDLALPDLFAHSARSSVNLHLL